MPQLPLEPKLTPAKMSFEEICALIDATGWSFQFNRDQIKVVARYVKVFTARKGEVVFQEKARELYMCFVLSGSVDVLKSTPAGDMKIVGLGKGQVFGEMALIDGEPRSATVVAAADTILMVFNQDKFMEFSEEHPDLGFRLVLKIAKMMSQRLRRADDELAATVEEEQEG